MMMPRDVKCPLCNAEINRWCGTRSINGTYRAKTHLARWKAAGIARPTVDDLHRAYEDGKRRDIEAIQTLAGRRL